MELEPKYNHQKVEKNKNETWKNQKYFEANPKSEKPPFTIILPPPNVTGKLHLGHAWDNSIQDLLIRYKKLRDYDTFFVAGMDHAGIATQIKVEQELAKRNLSKYDLGREKFIAEVWTWKNDYAKTIREQWAKLGLGLDYSREYFTFSPEVNKIVNKVFVKMYNENLIYKDRRIINWDPLLLTAVSNIEVVYKETAGKMYYLRYRLKSDSNKFLVVATTRPETMFVDEVLVVNPTDERYLHYLNQEFINPANNEVVKLIADDYVDKKMGTGVMKCTPAHDVNDFEIAKRHNLNFRICLNKNGTINEYGSEFAGLDRFEARQKLIEKITSTNNLEKIEEITHQVGYSERSDVVIEPYLSSQWFVKMKTLAEQVVDLQNSNDKIDFFSKSF